MARPDARDLLKRYEEAKSLRAPFENDMRMAATFCLPRQLGAWNAVGPGIMQAPSSTGRLVYDSTGLRSLSKYASILNRLLTPEGQKWMRLRNSNTQLMKIARVARYYDELNAVLFRMRYEGRARFTQSVGEMYISMGVYGMGPISVKASKKIEGLKRGFSYKAWRMSDIFVLADDEGNIDTVFRRYWLNARNFKRSFPEAAPPQKIAAELNKQGGPSETTMFEIVQVLCPRDDYDPGRLDARMHRIVSYNIAVSDAEYIGDDEGFRSLPILTPRVMTEAGELYGYSPAMQAMPALGGVSAQKKTLLKQGHKAVDPPLLASDDASISGRVDMRPSKITFGGLNSRGEAMVKAVETKANWQVADVLLQDEREDIKDAFFVTLFQILNESPEMTATEVVERVAEKSSLLAPTMGRLQSEFADQCVQREIEIAADLGRLPEMPPEVLEAGAEYEVMYTSPLAKGMYAEDVAGFMRWQEALGQYTQLTQNPAAMDWINIDEAAPAIADYMSVPPRFVRSKDEVEELRNSRQDEAQDDKLLQQAPAIASVAKAAMDKGMNVGG